MDDSSSSYGESIFSSRSPSTSNSSIIPPRGDEIDRWQRHIGMKEFAKYVQRAAESVYPNSNRSRYSNVYVLIFKWETEDPKLPVQCEIDELRRVLEEIYGYEIEIFEIPDHKSHAKVVEKITAFIAINDDSKNDLKIVYYAGHSRLSHTKDLVWSSWESSSNHKCSTVTYTGIQHSLEQAESDVLILLDSCSSGIGDAGEGHGVTELMAACAFDTIANGVGHYSFTKALTTELFFLSQKRSFPVVELYTRVYCRAQHHMPQGIKDERHPAPIHLLLTRDDLFPRGLQLSIQERSSAQTKEKGPGSLQDQSSIIEQNSTKRLRDHDVDILSNKRPCLSSGETPPTETTDSAPECPESSQTMAQQLQEELGEQSILVPGLDKPMENNSSVPSGLQSTISQFSGDAPRLLFSVRLQENIKAEDLSVECFADWLRIIPAIAEEVTVEGVFKSDSTLVLLALPFSLWSYLPSHPAVLNLGPIRSPNILIPDRRNQPSAVNDTSKGGASLPLSHPNNSTGSTMSTTAWERGSASTVFPHDFPRKNISHKIVPFKTAPFACGTWRCSCNPRLPASHLQVKKQGPNIGRWFYTCQKPKESGCGFFRWDNTTVGREMRRVIGRDKLLVGIKGEDDEFGEIPGVSWPESTDQESLFSEGVQHYPDLKYETPTTESMLSSIASWETPARSSKEPFDLDFGTMDDDKKVGLWRRKPNVYSDTTTEYQESIFDAISFATLSSQSGSYSVPGPGRQGLLSRFAEAGMKGAIAGAGAGAGAAACWRCKFLQKSCDILNPCLVCPPPGPASPWATIGCRRGSLVSEMPPLELCPVIESKGVSQHKIGIKRGITSIRENDYWINRIRTRTLMLTTSYVPWMEARSGRIWLIETQPQLFDLWLNSCYSRAPSVQNSALAPVEECILDIIWEAMEDPWIEGILLRGDVIDSINALIHLLWQAAQYQISIGADDLIPHSLRCLRGALEAIAIKERYKQISHHSCNARTCSINCIATLDAHITYYLQELTRVLFVDGIYYNKECWWLSVFYSLCIQGMVRTILMELVKSSTADPSKHTAVKEYLHLPAQLFIAISGSYDPLVESPPSSGILEEDQAIVSARKAVRQEIWWQKGINRSSDYLKRLFGQDDGSGMETDSSKGKGAADADK